MVQGNNIQAEIDVPSLVEIPRRGKNVTIDIRVSLVNSGDETFVAHAESGDESSFIHVFNSKFREVTREPGAGKGGHKGPKVKNGVHSYRTITVPAGGGVNANRRFKLDATKLKAGETYNVRGEVYGHLAEATFVAVPQPTPSPLRRTAAKKSARKKKAAKKRAAKK